MVAAVAHAMPTSSDDYRRKARRLRCRYAGQPATLQFALKLLAGEAKPDLSPAPAGPARRFAEYLASRAPSMVLRYSERLELIRAARHMGIDRFEANLLIASVLERGRRVTEAEAAQAVTRSSPLLAGIAVFLMVQSAVLLGAWWAVFR
jgi:hypothetical protein